MQVFVDSIGHEGLYRVMDAPSWLSPELPVEVLMMVGLADGSLDVPLERGGSALLYHVESGRYLTAENLAGAGVEDLDTLVVVRAKRGRFPDCDRIDRQWHRLGGAHRRIRHAGMHIRPQRDPFDDSRTLH